MLRTVFALLLLAVGIALLIPAAWLACVISGGPRLYFSGWDSILVLAVFSALGVFALGASVRQLRKARDA